MESNRFLKGIFYFLIFMSIILAGTMLKVLESFFKPVVLAILLASVLYPFVKRINQKFKIPWLLGIIIVYIVFLIIFSGIFNILSSSIISIVESYPKYEERFRTIYHTIQAGFWFQKQLFLLKWGCLALCEPITTKVQTMTS